MNKVAKKKVVITIVVRIGGGGTAMMSELQRELILSERAQKKDDKSLKEKFRPKWDKGKAPHSWKETPPLPSSRVHSSARSADRAHRKLRYAFRSEDDGSSGDDAMIDSDDERSEGLTFGLELGGQNLGLSMVGAVRAGIAATAAALEAAAGAGKLIDTSAPVDFGRESNLKHKFELPISLAALQNFGKTQGSWQESSE
ncbi:hypothetical protein TB2_010430 [Malus domestica]